MLAYCRAYAHNKKRKTILACLVIGTQWLAFCYHLPFDLHERNQKRGVGPLILINVWNMNGNGKWLASVITHFLEQLNFCLEQGPYHGSPDSIVKTSLMLTWYNYQ